MLKSKLAILIDSLFISFGVFILSFVWINKFIKNANYSTFLSIMLSLFAFIIIFNLFKKNRNNILTSNQNKNFIKNCLNFLQFSDNRTYIIFLEKLLDAKHISNYLFKIKNSYVYINIKYTITDKEFLEIHNLFKSQNSTESKLYFLINSTSDSFKNLLNQSNCNYQIFEPETLAKIMQQNNIYPIEKIDIQKIKFRDSTKRYLSKKIVINRKQFKHLFFSGISLLIISLITPFSLLYLIIGSLLILLSLISLFIKNKKQDIDNSEIFQ